VEDQDKHLILIKLIQNIMEKETAIWEWNPLISLGPLKFGDPIEPVISEFSLYKLDKPFEEADWDSYEFPNCDKRIYAEEKHITSIGCFDDLYYNGQDLFGLTIEKIKIIFGEEYKTGEVILFDFEDDEFEETPIRFYNYGLQVWIKNGVVESAIIRGVSTN
jgi:hypothetical protein